MDIIYTEDLANVTPNGLTGFFIGWPNPPSNETLYKMLAQSTYRVIAWDASTFTVVGYVTGLSDGVLFGYVSSLEVKPQYQKMGIGRELMVRLLDRFEDIYAVDLVCDPDVQAFYKKCGMRPCSAMIVRHYDRQTGV